MKSKGLGDSIEKITKATGIKTMTEVISKGLNVPCGLSSEHMILFIYCKGFSIQKFIKCI